MGLQELQDRIDELQAEQALQRLGRRSQACSQPLADHMESEMESLSPGMESDPGTPQSHTGPKGLSSVWCFSHALEVFLKVQRTDCNI